MLLRVGVGVAGTSARSDVLYDLNHMHMYMSHHENAYATQSSDSPFVTNILTRKNCGYLWLELVLAGEEYRRASHPPGGRKASAATKIEGSQRKRATRARIEELLRRVAAPADEAKAMLGIELEVE